MRSGFVGSTGHGERSPARRRTRAQADGRRAARSGVTTFGTWSVGDLDVMIDVLRAVGASVTWTGPDELHDRHPGELPPEAPYELVTRLRASINVLGPLLARCGEARVAMPGGDNIGSRSSTCTSTARGHGRRTRRRARLHRERGDTVGGARIVLEFPSVGATENLLTATVLAKGKTVIENAAREPEITDSPRFSTGWAREVLGAGTSTIDVEGVESSKRWTPRSWATASRPARSSWRAGSRGASRARGRTARALRDGRAEARRDGAAHLPRSTATGFGTGRGPSGRRHRHARRSGLRHRFHADGPSRSWR